MARRVRSTRLVWLAALCWLFVGCSSGGDASATTTSAEVTTQPAASASASATSTETTTTTATTTSTSESSTSPEDAAAQAVLAQSEAWIECIADVPTCDAGAALASTTTGESLAALIDLMESWQRNGWEARPPEDPKNLRDEVVETEVLNGEMTRVRVRHCQVDGGVLVDPGAGSDGADVIINDEVLSTLSDDFVVLGSDDLWRVEAIEVLTRTQGGSGCAVES